MEERYQKMKKVASTYNLMQVWIVPDLQESVLS
jgi:hypothetical protein